MLDNGKEDKHGRCKWRNCAVVHILDKLPPMKRLLANNTPALMVSIRVVCIPAWLLFRL
jgi:hypothetical protein